jgi:uroporphyrinogen-III synthase/BMFP domain-containing protein YqiC
MRFLVTRAEDAASRTAQRLERAGHEIIRAPLLTITPLPFAWPQGPFDALLATSGNAFAGWTQPCPFTALPLFTVGERTAERARAAGFPQAIARGHNADELSQFLLGDLPVSTRFLYLAGAERRPQLETKLRQAGRFLAVVETYRATPSGPLSEAARAALTDGKPLTVLHFSPRSARLFLAASEGLATQNPIIRHLALSEAVAAPLIAAGCAVTIATAPNEDAMLALAAPAEGEDSVTTPIRTGLEGEDAAMSDSETQGQPASPKEPPIIEASIVKPAPATGPVLTAALGGGLVGAALIGVGLWAISPSNDHNERLSAVETAIGNSATRRNVEALEKRIGTIEAKLPEIETAAKRPLPPPQAAPAPAITPPAAANDDGQLTRALQEMRNDLASLAQRLSALEKTSADNAAKIPSPEKLDALNRDMAQLSSRITSTEKSLAATNPNLADGSGLAVAVALKTRLQDGQPFAKEWVALSGLKADQAALNMLKPYADKGIPSAAMLAAAFAGPARLIAATPQAKAPSEAAWTDKITNALGRLVRVTPIDPSKGEDPVSLTVRIQTALAKDNSNEALALWKKLPEPARNETSAWGRDLEARVNAENAVAQLMSGMVDRLGAAKP